MKILIINGPNLNLLGIREPELYGDIDFNSYLNIIKDQHPDVIINYLQSNHEGEIIDFLHDNGFGKYNGIILNPGGYSHYSVAIADAISAINTPVVEVHISNIFARDDYRQKSITAAKCAGMITGIGLKGYDLAIEFFRNN